LLDISSETNEGVKQMDASQTENNFDRLTKRREHLVMTLRHLDRESEQVEQNTDWLDQAAYENRTALLDRLNDWYLAEVQQIDRALDRIKSQKYGICLACHSSIDLKRLDIVPETEYCGACETFREGFEQSGA
jgi:RNA polymerase-binding transcription factor DksA